MKKLFFGLCVLSFGFLATQKVSAQEPTFLKGDQLAGVSIGLGGYYSGSWYSDVSRIPFIALYYEKCVKDNLFDEKSSLGIGGILGYTQATVADVWKSSSTVIGLRGAVHYAFVDKLDVYGGLILGYTVVNWKWLGSDLGKGNAASDVALGGFVGARYYFNEKLAAFAEFGYGAANVNLGVSIKF